MSNKASSEGAAAILEPEVEEATVPVEDAGRETGQDPGGEAEGNLGGSDQTAPLPLHARVEALLLCSERPLTDQRLAELLGLVAPPPAEAAETAVWLDFALRFEYIDPAIHAQLADRYDHVCRQLELMMQSPNTWLKSSRNL